MSSDLREQIRQVVASIEYAQAPILGADVRAGRVGLASTSGDGSPPMRRLVIVAVAFAVVLILVGGVAWLLPTGDTAPPASELTPPTTIASTNTTLAEEAVQPPGDGTQLNFVPVDLSIELSSGERIGDGVWFQGALYAISGGQGHLFRSSDGFKWEFLAGPPHVADLHSHGLEAGGELLVYAGVDGAEGSAGECSLPGDAIVVHTSNNGIDWETSRINLPVPDWSTDSGCFRFFVDFRDGLVAGPQGVMATALVQSEIVAESIFEPEFGLGLDPKVVEEAIRGGVGVFTAADGHVYGIDLDGAGGHLWFSGRGYAWFSPDGQTWSRLDASGPLDGGEIAAVVATSGGFVASSTSSGSPSPPGRAQDLLWETTDGTTWIEKPSRAEGHLSDPFWLGLWNGQLVSASENGVWTIEHTPRELIPSGGTSGMGMQVSGLGLVGVRSRHDGAGTELLFSQDGTTWSRWTPPGFGPSNGQVRFVGIGDDFVALYANDTYWVGRLP